MVMKATLDIDTNVKYSAWTEPAPLTTSISKSEITMIFGSPMNQQEL